MNQSMNVPTVKGTCGTPLLATFSAQIGGEPYTFGVHVDVGFGQRFKVSEFTTGMGIADVMHGDRVASIDDQFEEADILDFSEMALQRVIQAHGESAVAAILTTNRTQRPVINLAA